MGERRKFYKRVGVGYRAHRLAEVFDEKGLRALLGRWTYARQMGELGGIIQSGTFRQIIDERGALVAWLPGNTGDVYPEWRFVSDQAKVKDVENEESLW